MKQPQKPQPKKQHKPKVVEVTTQKQMDKYQLAGIDKKKHYGQEEKLVVFTTICELVSQGISLPNAVKQVGEISYMTFHLWKNKEDGFAEIMERAYDIYGEVLFDKHKEINEQQPMINPTTGGIDSGWVSWQKTKQEAIKWQAGVTRPKKFGNKVDVDAKVSIQPVTGMEIL